MRKDENGDWVKLFPKPDYQDKGHRDLSVAEINAEQISKRNGGTLIGIMHKGEIVSEYFKGKNVTKCHDLKT